MNARYLAPLLLLAACGGKGPAPAPKPAPSAAETDYLGHAAGVREHACMCGTDAACARNHWNQGWIYDFYLPVELTLTDDGAAQLATEYIGARVCMRKALGDAFSPAQAAADEATLLDHAVAAEAAMCACTSWRSCSDVEGGPWRTAFDLTEQPTLGAAAAARYGQLLWSGLQCRLKYLGPDSGPKLVVR